MVICELVDWQFGNGVYRERSPNRQKKIIPTSVAKSVSALQLTKFNID